MLDYTAPVDDMMFSLDLIGYNELARRETFAHADLGTVKALLEEYGRLTGEVVSPTNEVGDHTGAIIDKDAHTVTSPAGFREAYQAFVDGGWSAVAAPPEYGGGGFPGTIALALSEMTQSANMAFSLCPLLSHGSVDALMHWGSEAQRNAYLPKIISGEWTGTMNLTEPDAGSDVGALRTKAVQAADGTWRITGQKIYITWGEHDLTDNIIHLVLARVEGAPPGTKGISCFIVPKYLVNADGSLGARNDVKVVSLEHKMGINASPTCVMAYGDDGEGAVGELIGEVNTGMRVMFTMMNNARLNVGQTGLAVAERAYQLAYSHATSRVQSKVTSGSGDDTIIGHADIRRMLLTMRSQIEAMRHLVLANAKAVDDSATAETGEARAAGQELADLYTPLTKAWCTDLGNELASLGVQIHGGMGFCEDTGAAQLYRDIRIAAIYEGTNGIQALDLVGRKLAMRGGAVLAEVLGGVEAAAKGLPDELAEPVRAAVELSLDLAKQVGTGSPLDAQAGATPFLRIIATTVGAGFMAKQWTMAADRDDHVRQSTAAFFLTQIVPTVHGLAAQVRASAAPLFELSAADLASR